MLIPCCRQHILYYRFDDLLMLWLYDEEIIPLRSRLKLQCKTSRIGKILTMYHFLVLMKIELIRFSCLMLIVDYTRLCA